MKHSRYISLVFLASLAALILFQGCEDMNGLHEKYLESERVYAAKVDSAYVKGGNYRAELVCNITVCNIADATIYWNGDQDSIVFPINSEKGMVSIAIDNLEEQSYVFNIVTKDIHGNKSLIYETVGDVYGDFYKSTLVTRGYEVVAVREEVTIVWKTPKESLVEQTVTYTNTGGETVELKVLPDDEYTFLPGFAGDLVEVSGYKPDDNAIDIFYAEPFSDFVIPDPLLLDYTTWQVLDFSSNHNDGEHSVRNFIDGDPSTGWHTLVDWGGGRDYPHWVIVDMGYQATFSSINFYNKIGDQSNWGPEKFELYLSNDGENWELLGEFDVDSRSQEAQSFEVNVDAPAQYWKYVATEFPDNAVNWGAEIMIAGELQFVK